MNLSQMLTLLKNLVETESPSSEAAAVQQVARLVERECLRLGAQTQFEAGGHLLARWNASAPGKPILLLHHMDTVFPLGTLAAMPFRSDAEKSYGPGVLDMKGGIVISLAAIERHQRSGNFTRPLMALFTTDEEIGSGSSQALIESLARQSQLALVLESGLLDGAIKTWRKGVGDFVIRVRGVAAHSGGEHEKGRNAIEELAHQVLTVQGWTDYTKGTTLNVGVIRGGTVENVVPAEAEARGDLRILDPAEGPRILAALQALQPQIPGTSVQASGTLNRAPMPFDATMRTTYEKARQIAAAAGIDLKAGGSGGGSDANFIAPLGVPVLDGLGAVGADYHSEREWIYTQSLEERARLLEALLRAW
ncbi:MAG: M20 family metallopeptidase [Anaerolineales bacterium]